jgi:hypothetical protein
VRFRIIRFSAPERVNGCQAKILEAFNHLVAKPSYQRERGVPECGEDLRRMPGMSTCLVFAVGHIAYVTKTILNPQCTCDRPSYWGGPACSAVRLVIA